MTTESMRIGFVSNVVYPFITGGAEKRIHEIGGRLVTDGHKVTVYGRHFWDGPQETVHDGMRLRAVAPSTGLYVENDRRSITEAVDFAARLLPSLRSHIGEHDVIVVSVFPYFPVLSAKLCTVATDTPVVTTWHEVWGDYWNEYLGKLAVGGKAVQQLAAWVPQKPIAVSDVTANRLAEIGPRRERIQIVPNGIDKEQIRSINPVNNGFDILFAGRLIEDKHVDRIIKGFDCITPEENISLGIIGDGPQRNRLERIANRCDVKDQISFLDFLDDYEDVLAHMKAASIFVSPSTREGFGITYLEAMAAGCTVIGADHPDSAASEVINDAGFVVEPTVDALADILDRTLAGERPSSDPRSVAAQYDWDSIATQAESVYQDAILEKND
jgi:glycosyltransferase involved in cell wall biosynthesis